MFPVSLDLSRIDILLVGNDARAVRRLSQLDEGGAQRLTVWSPSPTEALAQHAGSRLRTRLPEAADIPAGSIVMILPSDDTDGLEALAKQQGALVNVEDVTEQCDFHFVSQVRRGDLLVTVSTNGKSPTVARELRKTLDAALVSDWDARLEDIASRRLAWKEQGHSMEQLAAQSVDYIKEQQWLGDELCPRHRLNTGENTH